jgi:hypothetical protein
MAEIVDLLRVDAAAEKIVTGRQKSVRVFQGTGIFDNQNQKKASAGKWTEKKKQRYLSNPRQVKRNSGRHMPCFNGSFALSSKN